MGWERGLYYTRSRKVNGRVVREYVGSGVLGSMAARLDALEREEREGEARDGRALWARLVEQDAALNDFDERCDLLVRAALLAAGFRRHHRGEWRKHRAGDDEGG